MRVVVERGREHFLPVTFTAQRSHIDTNALFLMAEMKTYHRAHSIDKFLFKNKYRHTAMTETMASYTIVCTSHTCIYQYMHTHK